MNKLRSTYNNRIKRQYIASDFMKTLKSMGLCNLDNLTITVYSVIIENKYK